MQKRKKMDDNKININDPEIIGEPILSSDSEITVDAVAIEELRQTTTEIVSEGLETEIDRKENVAPRGRAKGKR